VLNFANLSLVLLWRPFPRAPSGVLYNVALFGSRRTRHSRGFTLFNYPIQKNIKHRQSFPNDEAAMKLMFMGLKNISGWESLFLFTVFALSFHYKS
jgi:hypothetical protein